MPEMTLNEIRERGNAALLRELGPSGYVQYLRQFQVGRGDWSRDRHPWADRLTREEIREGIERLRRRRTEQP